MTLAELVQTQQPLMVVAHSGPWTPKASEVLTILTSTSTVQLQLTCENDDYGILIPEILNVAWRPEKELLDAAIARLQGMTKYSRALNYDDASVSGLPYFGIATGFRRVHVPSHLTRIDPDATNPLITADISQLRVQKVTYAPIELQSGSDLMFHATGNMLAAGLNLNKDILEAAQSSYIRRKSLTRY